MTIFAAALDALLADGVAFTTSEEAAARLTAEPDAVPLAIQGAELPPGQPVG